MYEDQTIQIVRNPHTHREFHLLVDDPDEPLEVTQCGDTTSHIPAWLPLDPTDAPPTLGEFCPSCLTVAGQTAQRHMDRRLTKTGRS